MTSLRECAEQMDDEELIHRVHGAAGALFAMTCIQPDGILDNDECPASIGIRGTALQLWFDTSEMVRRFNKAHEPQRRRKPRLAAAAE